MIFVTVGMHEQPFDRLVACVDSLKRAGVIQEEVIIQTGVSTYEPQCCQWSNVFSYQQMERNVADARIVITHGGPSSFMMSLRAGKIPIVVPRRKRFGEHINDHQINFLRQISEQEGNIIVVEDIAQLAGIIRDYDAIAGKLRNTFAYNNRSFCEEFGDIVTELLAPKR